MSDPAGNRLAQQVAAFTPPEAPASGQSSISISTAPVLRNFPNPFAYAPRLSLKRVVICRTDPPHGIPGQGKIYKNCGKRRRRELHLNIGETNLGSVAAYPPAFYS